MSEKSIRLKSGQMMEILETARPSLRERKKILKFLEHKGTLWLEPLRKMLAGEIVGARARMYLGRAGREYVGNVSIFSSPAFPVGILSHVYTMERWRRRGVASGLIKSSIQNFEERGGKILILGTGYRSRAFFIYKRFGFKARGRRGLMLWGRPAAERKILAKSDTHIEDFSWQYLPGFSLLLASRKGSYIRSIAYGLRGSSTSEGTFYRIMRDLGRGRIQDGKLLISGNRAKFDQAPRRRRRAVVGFALLVPDDRFGDQVYILDFFCHLNFQTYALDLLNALKFPRRKVQCYATADDEAKIRALKRAGFRPEALLKGQIKFRGKPADIFVFSMLK